MNELGTLEMKRARGRLEVAVVERPRRFLLKGKHFELDQPNLAGFSGDVPEGLYTLGAVYPGFVVATNLTVLRDTTNRLDARAELVAVRLTSEPAGAAMKLERDDVFTVELKAGGEHTTPPLPAGAYVLSGTLPDGYQARRTVEVKPGGTNEAVLVFPYGTVELTSVPAGAEVGDAAGRRLGRTPLTLRQVRPGEHRYRVQHPGCEVREAVIVVGDGKVVRTELKLEPQGVAAARKLVASPEGVPARRFSVALNDLEQAVRLRPDDASLGLMVTNLLVARALATAREQEAAGRPAGALADVREALRLRPGVAEAEAMLQRLEAKVAVAEAEQRANAIQTRLATARRYAADGRVADSLREVEAVLAAEPAKDEALKLRGELLARQQAADDARAAELRVKQESERRQREAEQIFERAIAGMRDQDLFETHRWHFNVSEADVLQGVDGMIASDPNDWRRWFREVAPKGSVHLRSGYRPSLPTLVRDAILVVQEYEPGRTVVIAKFWHYRVSSNARLVNGEIPEGLIPVHPDYVRQGAPPNANAQRARFALDFQSALSHAVPKR